MHPHNFGCLFADKMNPFFIPATAKACIYLLDFYFNKNLDVDKIDYIWKDQNYLGLPIINQLQGKITTIVGSGDIIGKPL